MVLNESDRNVHHGGCGDNGAEECWSDSNTAFKSPGWIEPGYYRFKVAYQLKEVLNFSNIAIEIFNFYKLLPI